MSRSEIRDHASKVALKEGNSIPGMLAYWDKDQHCGFSNDAYLDWFGRRSTDMLGIHIEELLGDLYTKNLPYIERALQGAKQTFERQIRVPSGELRDSLAIYTPDIVNSVVQGFTAHVIDVTFLRQRERAWEKLATQRAGFSRIAEHSPDIISRFDHQLRHVYVNREVEKITGIPAAQFIGKTNEELGMNPGLCARWNRVLNRVLAGSKQETIDFTFPCGENEEHYSTLCVPEISEAGEVEGVLCVARNVTELRRSGDIAIRRESQLKFAADAANMGIFEWQCPAGDFICKNQLAADLIGLEDGQRSLPTGKVLQLFQTPREPDALRKSITAAKESGKAFKQICFIAESARQPKRWLEIVGRIEPGEPGALPHCVGFITDVTERVAATERLSIERDRAEQANQAKDRFLATLSHELRTPLTPALMLLDLMESQSDVPESVRGDLAVIRDNVKLGARLVDDLLDLARITTGKMRLSLEPCSPESVLTRALQTVAPELAAKKIRVTTSYAKSAGTVLGDPMRLQQVFWNLLRNAAKFTPVGGQVLVHTAELGSSWKLSITDTGVGLAAEDLSRIFDSFVQARPVTDMRAGGLGLGLSISSSLVREHGGRIWAESNGIGKGATFIVEIPLQPGAKPEYVVTREPARPVAMPRSKLQILVVEDHASTLSTMLRILGIRGHEAQGARNIADARRLVESSTFDLLICDLGLPDGNGADLMRHLKEKQRIPGIALSGHGMETHLIATRSAGFDAHLVKPVAVPELDKAIAVVTGSAI